MAALAPGQAPTADVMGQHDLGSWGPAPIQGALTTCQYCHAVHSGLATVRPLWSQNALHEWHANERDAAASAWHRQ